MRAKRVTKVEQELQVLLDNGADVWVIGDVHGHAKTLAALIDKLDIEVLDRIVLLGDLVDRGPDSCEVVKMARENHQIFAVKGNHEEMMLKCFEPTHIENPGLNQAGWYYIGGRETAESYIETFQKPDGNIDNVSLLRRAGKDLAWMDSLPDHIVLDDWRLVHAGYSPNEGELDSQTTDSLLWVRGEFHNSTQILDQNRTIVFGHSTMIGFGIPQDGIWRSELELDNGNSAALGIDSCCYGGDAPQLTAINLRNQEIVKQLIVN